MGVQLMEQDNPEEKTGLLEERKKIIGKISRKEGREHNSRYIRISDFSRTYVYN